VVSAEQLIALRFRVAHSQFDWLRVLHIKLMLSVGHSVLCLKGMLAAKGMHCTHAVGLVRMGLLLQMMLQC
jgi:hypothetical protein